MSRSNPHVKFKKIAINETSLEILPVCFPLASKELTK
jgi:hypothetical protein